MESRHPKTSASVQTTEAQQMLMACLRKNDTAAVEDILKQKEKHQLDLRSPIDGTHPLSVAISKKNTSLVRLLLKNGAPLSGLHFFTAICHNVPADLLEEMLAHMAQSHQSIAHFEMNMSGLHKLLQRVPEAKRDKVTLAFKKYGIDMTSATSVCPKFTVLHAAVLLQSPPEIIEMLLRYDAQNHHCPVKAYEIAKALDNDAITHLLEGEEIPLGQSWIIDAVKTVMPDEAAAYGEIGGLCYALGLKHGEAYLLETNKAFNKKFHDIANIDINELNNYMNKVECEVLSYETRRASLASKMSALKNKKDSQSTQQLAKFSKDMEYLDIFQKASEKTLELNTLITDTFKLTLNPELNYSTEMHYLNLIGWDKASLVHGGIRVGHCYTGMYDIKELTTYLKELAHFAEQIDYRFSVHLDNWGHAVNLCYDKTTKTFIFFDANAMPAKSSTDAAVVSKWIMDAIIPLINKTRKPTDANDTLCLQSRFLVTGNNVQRFKTDIQKNLLKRANWMKIHEPTQKKITSLDSVEHSWLLLSVIQKENIDEINELIAKGANPNLSFKRIHTYNSTPLYSAVDQQNVTLVEALLNAKPEGANPNQAGINGFTPLHKAVITKNITVVEALLNAKPEGANPNQASANGFTPLYAAIESGDIAIVTLLLDHLKNTKQEIAYVDNITTVAQNSDDFSITLLVINQINDEADARRQREQEKVKIAQRKLIKEEAFQEQTNIPARRQGFYLSRKVGQHPSFPLLANVPPQTQQVIKAEPRDSFVREDKIATGIIIPEHKPQTKKQTGRLQLDDTARLAKKDKHEEKNSSPEIANPSSEKLKRRHEEQLPRVGMEIGGKQKQQKKANEVTHATITAPTTTVAKDKPVTKKDVKAITLGSRSVFGSQQKKTSAPTKPMPANQKTGLGKKTG